MTATPALLDYYIKRAISALFAGVWERPLSWTIGVPSSLAKIGKTHYTIALYLAVFVDSRLYLGEVYIE
jgi:hypothetical protein